MSGNAKPIPRLPRLPVPPLRKTLDRYLKSIEPFLLEDEARGGAPFADSYAARRRWADEFERGPGGRAQEALVALDRSPASPHNWLDDTIWLKTAYHEARAPLPVNSNWWLAFLNDPAVPVPPSTLIGSGEGEDAWAGVTPWQLRRAAWLVWRTLDFKERLDREELHPSTTRTGIWLRDSTSRIFNTCRVPRPHCDALSPQGPSPHATKLLVAVHDWHYLVDCYLPPRTDGQAHRTRIPAPELERRLRQIARDAEGRLGGGERAVPVGVLSADGRDAWAENYEHLRGLSPTNAHTLDAINHSLLALSLDNYTHTFPPPPSSSPPTPPSSSPSSSSRTSKSKPTAHAPPADLDAHLHQIRAPPDARNRWFDKPLTLVVEACARAGAMGEHSPCDALVPSIVCEYAVVGGIGDAETSDVDANVAGGATGTGIKSGTEGGWERLGWVTDGRIERECARVEGEARARIADSDDSGLWFTDYGSDWIKDVAKLSPDAYIQMALQLAWYKTRGAFTATYETALTRMFARGRTETIRTYTTDSRAWVLSMVQGRASLTERKMLLHRAITTHAALTREAATGRGIDRHLLGLRLMLAQQPGGAAPVPLLSDELFQRSQAWKLSTSGLSAGHQFRGTGFGSAYPDGYGINCELGADLAGPDVIKFGVETKHSSRLTSTEVFKAAISASLREVRQLCSADPESSPIVSHL
ncbi:acyltransferase ChoActase/COT/CPT [Athelia psychrophila]|uniref:Acyltransferase ChoActase/COT/CPT n=1 Tax=Athelia psychrophila TaxID=1759441 RepID=A0A166NNF1_9AGAM|nr:acyltransferase ChoActase/COT/CPT [Fibularhizoctonia sp. CBS 109695]